MTVAEKKPSEIARDTLKLLLTRKLAPTPANFRTVYHEVAGTPDVPPFPADSLRHIIQALPLRTPAQQRSRAQLDHAIAQQNWSATATPAQLRRRPPVLRPRRAPKARTRNFSNSWRA